MKELIFCNPSLAVIADSGQKHLIFRAKPGYWQFEEMRMLPCPELLAVLLGSVERLYSAGATKSEIETGRYSQKTMKIIGLQTWRTMELEVKPHRGGLPLLLALFLAQKEIENGPSSDSE